MSKRRILHVGEFSRLATGYAVYADEVMKRLHATGKYELAELACYTSTVDPRLAAVPWKVYPNHPVSPQGDFYSRRTNEFGEYRFEETCIDFRPDVVWSIRDVFMDEFIATSPLRPYYRWAYMPTVDAVPQHEQWLAVQMDADVVFTYSDWGADVLRREGGGLINVLGSASPGADLETFRPMDRATLRKQFHFEDDVNIVGMAARNQARKLFPELIDGFAAFLERAPAEMARKTYLYLHTSYPDIGWDIPRLIKRSGIGSRILVTYKCVRCGAVFPSFFADAATTCNHCGAPDARMPNVHVSVDRTTLAKIYNLFDVYVQYANMEGLGMPQVEAAACGVPVFAVDYSAMSDVVRKVSGFPIRVSFLKLESDLGRYMAAPDGQDLVEKLIHHFSLPTADRQVCSESARRGVEDHYRWDETVDKWMRAFDTMPASDDWDSPPRLHTPAPVPKSFDTHTDLVRWCIANVLGRPDLVGSYLEIRLVRDLNWGLTPKRPGNSYANEDTVLTKRGDLKPFGIDDMIHELRGMCNHRNYWETRRGRVRRNCQ